MQTYTLTETVSLTTVTCYKCAVVFAMPTSLRQQRLEDHDTFWCPNGHGQCFTGKTEAEKERERAERAERWLENSRAHARAVADQLSATQRTLAATKGHLTRQKKRATAGACPAGCHRHFANLQAHMAAKHPGYGESPTP